MCKMNCVYIKIMLKVESLKTELLKVSPPVPCSGLCWTQTTPEKVFETVTHHFQDSTQ
jgi:hypothetical protein